VIGFKLLVTTKTKMLPNFTTVLEPNVDLLGKDMRSDFCGVMTSHEMCHFVRHDTRNLIGSLEFEQIT